MPERADRQLDDRRAGFPRQLFPGHPADLQFLLFGFRMPHQLDNERGQVEFLPGRHHEPGDPLPPTDC